MLVGYGADGKIPPLLIRAQQVPLIGFLRGHILESLKKVNILFIFCSKNSSLYSDTYMRPILGELMLHL